VIAFAERAATGHTLVDHTSEVVVRLRAPTFSGLLHEAAKAFVELAPPDLHDDPGDPEWREFVLEGSDRSRMLVDWFNELVFLAESECWLPADLDVREGQGGSGEEDRYRYTIRARGRRLTRPFVLVKAATLHGLQLGEGLGGFVGEVTLDV
jgi:SHS2 domain-containing protein